MHPSSILTFLSLAVLPVALASPVGSNQVLLYSFLFSITSVLTTWNINQCHMDRTHPSPNAAASSATIPMRDAEPTISVKRSRRRRKCSMDRRSGAVLIATLVGVGIRGEWSVGLLGEVFG